MPNHCSNDLYIRGPKKEVKRFIEAVKGEEEGEYRICQNLYPCPQELIDTPSGSFGNTEEEAEVQKHNIEKYGHKDWYDWCIANWGTKWGDYDTTIEDDRFMEDYSDDDSVIIEMSFDSAWSPPIPAFAKISQDFSELTFELRYYEGGMGFEGITRLCDGNISELYYSEDYWGQRGG